MNKKPRIDLDGVSLVDEVNPSTTLAIFRFRTTQGLMMLMPESAEFFIPKEAVASAKLDLMTGTVRIRLTPEYIGQNNWVRGATVLSGKWMDRVRL